VCARASSPWEGGEIVITDMSTGKQYEPMATAPRDGSLIIAKIADGRRPNRNRKHSEHIVCWAVEYGRPFWRSYTVNGAVRRDHNFAGWRPMDDEARQALEAQRDRKKARRRELVERRSPSERPER
jgi:hypothetical protein